MLNTTTGINVKAMARLSFHYLKWNFVLVVQFTSVIRGHHIYKSVWTPTLGEKLNCREDDRKEAKQHDEYPIGTYLEAYTGSELVGYVPMELYLTSSIHF